MAEGRLSSDMFTIDLKVTPVARGNEAETCLEARANHRETWHKRLGHINAKYLETMYRDGLVKGLDGLTGEMQACEICTQGKLSRNPFPNVLEGQAKRVLARIHVDLCGSMPVASFGGSRYILTIVNEYNRRYFIEFLKKKIRCTNHLTACH